MQQFLKSIKLQNVINQTKHCTFVLKLCLLFGIIALLAGQPLEKIQAATVLKLYDYSTKTTSTYSDKQIKVTYNGAVIGAPETPGILVNGIALLSYEDIFLNSGIAAECVYDKKKSTVSITKFSKTIVMTVGSTKATVNGTSVTLPTAPKKIKYVDTKLVKILVPSRFVSETLGLAYHWNSTTSTVAIDKNTILLSYNGGKQFEYTGAKGKVVVDKKCIDLGDMPSIITNNTAMLRAKKVFADSKIDADYSYDKKRKTVTLKKDKTVLVMTIGSKKAVLNNKVIKIDTAPILVKNHETNTSYVMVPGSFTSASLGYRYQWNNSTRTSVINSMAPELGDSEVVNETGTVLNKWVGQDSYYGVCSGIHELNSGITSENENGAIYSVVRDYTRTNMNAETFSFQASEPYGKVSSSNTGSQIAVSVDNLTCANQSYPMYGTSSNIINNISLINNSAQKSVMISIETITADFLYDISLSEDKLTLYVTVYKNVLKSATIGTNSAGDYITLEGANSLKPSISLQANSMVIDLPYTMNHLGDIATSISGTRYITQLIVITTTDRTQLYLTLNEGYTYYILENGNYYTLSFQAQGTVQPAVTDNTGTAQSSDSSDSNNNSDDMITYPSREIPTATDPSNYEIVIPRPAGITTTMLTDEDYYLSNCFVVRLEGDYTSLITEDSIRCSSDVVNKISVVMNSSNQTVIKVVTNKLQGYKIAWDNESIYINIGDPREIYQNIVVLDPGHGGAAVGAQYFGLDEKDINFKILYTIGKKFFNSDTSKLKVYYTRTSDTDLPLSARAAFVKQVDADLFVSLHMNAAEASDVCGTEVFYSKKNNSSNAAGLSSAKLASIFLTNLTNILGTQNRNVKEEAYTVIYKNTVPAVLIELGFLSNQQEKANLTNESFQISAAKTIYETILQVFDEYPTGR